MFNYLFVIFVLLTYTGCFYDTNGLIYQNGTSVDPSYVQIHVDTSSVLLPIDDDSSEKVAAKMVDTFELKRIRNEVINIILNKQKSRMKQYLTEEGWYGLVGLLYDEELYMAKFNDQFDRVFNIDFIKSLKGLKANYQDDIDVVNGGFVITVSRDYNRIDQFTGDTLFYDGGAAISLMFTPYKTGYRLTSVEPTGGGFY